MHPSAVRFEQWMLKNWWLHSINSINCLTSFRYVARKSYGRRSLVGCSPWGREELDSTERLHFQFSLSCIGEGNGNPLQCSRLENPRDGGAWWAALYGIAQSRTRLKRLSSSSSSIWVKHKFLAMKASPSNAPSKHPQKCPRCCLHSQINGSLLPVQRLRGEYSFLPWVLFI